MPLPAPRPYTNWLLTPVFDPATSGQTWPERSSIPLVRELIRRHAELPDYTRNRFQGTRAQKNALWREYRNYIHQGLSYFDGAITVADRSASLLYYYALLNFAKAELLQTHSSQIMGQRILHGLSYSPMWAKKLTSDFVKVQPNGVFPLLYEARTARSMSKDQRLKIQSVLSNIPEIGSQLGDSKVGTSAVRSLFHMIAMDATRAWPVLLAFHEVDAVDSTGKLFYRNFRQVQVQPTWRDHFGLSRRSYGPTAIYESIRSASKLKAGQIDPTDAIGITWRMRDILTCPYNASADAWICPSIYKSRMLPMPPSLARYVAIFYASSLVRYRPSMFDTQNFPENAYLFDAVARECALPLLVDVLSGLEGRPQIFWAEDALRL